MEQLPGIFPKFCLAFVAPVAVAHFVVRAGGRIAEAMFTQQFKGEAVNLSVMQDAAPAGAPGLTSRKVRTQ